MTSTKPGASSARPPNRPSRRSDLIAAAVDLFAIRPWELVTVSEIVDRAGMTSAAFYYHFSSRERLLEEVVGVFAHEWVEVIESLLQAAMNAEDLRRVPAKLLDQIDEAPRAARIFFLSAATAPQLAEQVHGDARAKLMRSATEAIRRIFPGRSAAIAKVNGVGMTVLYEMAARSHLLLDDTYRTLGPRRFREELARLSAVTCGATRG